MRAVVRFLRRPAARATWRYEAGVVLALEVLFVAAGVAAGPRGPAALPAIVVGGLSVVAAEAARVERSVEQRRQEADEVAGVARARLHCDAEVARARWQRDLVAWTWPVLPALVSAAFAGSLRVAAAVGVAVTVLRCLRDRVAYPAWRAWWRTRRG